MTWKRSPSLYAVQVSTGRALSTLSSGFRESYRYCSLVGDSNTVYFACFHEVARVEKRAKSCGRQQARLCCGGGSSSIDCVHHLETCWNENPEALCCHILGSEDCLWRASHT